MPNEGRKVLLFSDSRQRAANLARDMSNASDFTAARQLFAIALKMMEEQNSNQSLNSLYDYFCLAVGNRNVLIFHDKDRVELSENSYDALHRYKQFKNRNIKYTPRYTFDNAPVQMKEYLLRFFAGGYNTLYDSATSWLEPTDDALNEAVFSLDDEQISVTNEEFVDFFNAWILSICDEGAAIGHTIADSVRLSFRPIYNGYGLSKDWKFTKVIRDIMGWKGKGENCVERCWKRVLGTFLDSGKWNEGKNNGKLYIDLSRIKPRFDVSHKWFKCEQCSELTPFTLKEMCPNCGSRNIHKMGDKEYEALNFWRKPVDDAIRGEPIRVIDTEEHTAQLSYKDQRDSLWSKTEEYELRFQDLIQNGESPVDILSSTTTMEVGIDIGSLVAIGLRNIPPMRENYQQRAGRRGTSLSTIVTFCEDGPHDALFFKNPIPMFRGDPRRPWIDIRSERLLQRHLAMVILQEFLAKNNMFLDSVPATDFLDDYLVDFKIFLDSYEIRKVERLLPSDSTFSYVTFKEELKEKFDMLEEKRKVHPELFGREEGSKVALATSCGNNIGKENASQRRNKKVLLDVLYEEGVIPTYSFPKNVVSTYISDENRNIIYEVSRGLDVAISEYAPGREIVVDKQTYQIGGFYYPRSECRYEYARTPARPYTEDHNYVKQLISCTVCGWFDLVINNDKIECCPFCGTDLSNGDKDHNIQDFREMLRPWGFAPKNAESIPEVQISAEYTMAQQPLYSTLPDAEDMKLVPGCKNIWIASRTNQRIIMLNKGRNDRGYGL